MTSPAFLLPLLRPFLPSWWADRIPLDSAVSMGKELRARWDGFQLFAEPEAGTLFRNNLATLCDDVTYWSGGVARSDGGEALTSPDMERAALIRLAALCLARLAALEDRSGANG